MAAAWNNRIEMSERKKVYDYLRGFIVARSRRVESYEYAKKLYWGSFPGELPDYETYCKIAAEYVGI